MHRYDSEFYNMITEIIPDEKQIIPYVLKMTEPTSVVDFGCGEGRWLREVKRNDANIEVLGLDGYYVNQDRLLISQDEFRSVDLREKVELPKKYDLAISTEVAEHIEEEFIDIFLNNLAGASDTILFSAAIPGQGGEHHVNEQWQSYWVKKFKDRGYEADVSIRDYFWNDERVNCWRRQNLLMFYKHSGARGHSEIVDVVHPDIFQQRVNTCRQEMGTCVEYMLQYPERTEAIRKALEKLIRQERKIIIYPYGRNGRISELMLMYLFHYENFLIVDNKKGGKEENIFTFNAIGNEFDDAVILDVCSNTGIHQELLDEIEIKGKAANLERVSVFKIGQAVEPGGCVTGY